MQFKRAKTIKLFNELGNEITEYKAVVDEANVEQVFSIVGNGYKIAQHDEVLDIITKAVEDLKIAYNTRTTLMGNCKKEGARLRIDLNFPENYHTIAGEKIQLWATFDNSYDLSTGLRLEVNARIERTDTSLYCSEVISDQLNKHYHKHTKGLEIKVLEGTIAKGIEIFQNNIGKEFQELVETPLSILEARSFIKGLIESKEKGVAKKYLESISSALSNTDKVTSAWGLYSLISSILTKEVTSVDTRKNNARFLLNLIKRTYSHRKATVFLDEINQMSSDNVQRLSAIN